MGMIQCCLRGEPQDMHTGEPRRDGITGQQQGTPTTPNSASMIPRNLVSQISFHQGQQQSQQGYQPPGLGVQQQPTGLLAHQMQVDQSNSYVTISFPFQATGSGQGGQPAIVQSSIQVPGAITYPSPRAIQQPANFAAPPTAITGVVAPPKETSSPQPKQGVFTDTNPTAR